MGGTWGLSSLDVSSHHISWDRYGLSSAPSRGPLGMWGAFRKQSSWVLGQQGLLQNQLSLAHQSALCESLVPGSEAGKQ